MKWEPNKSFFEELKKGLNSLNISMSAEMEKNLIQYMQLLLRWNRVYNLTALTDPKEILIHHIFDSFSIAKYIAGERIIDVGSGAGFPGIPLAIIFSQKKFVLLDSIGKKTRFLTQVTAELSLTNVEVVQARVEEFFPKSCFNTIIVRAVGSIADMIEKTQHLLCSDGKLLLMKGRYPHAELQKVHWHVQVIPLQVPKLHKERHLVCIRRN